MIDLNKSQSATPEKTGNGLPVSGVALLALLFAFDVTELDRSVRWLAFALAIVTAALGIGAMLMWYKGPRKPLNRMPFLLVGMIIATGGLIRCSTFVEDGAAGTALGVATLLPFGFVVVMTALNGRGWALQWRRQDQHSA